jgi:hypothetical protein
VDQSDYVALALRAERRSEASDCSEIADCWRKLAQTYWLLAGQLAGKDRMRTNGKSKDEATS